MSLQSLATAQSDARYSKLFHSRPHRFVLSLAITSLILTPKICLGENLVTYSNAYDATAHLFSKNNVHLVPGQICNVGCETPTINCDAYNAKSYRYFLCQLQ